MDQAIPQYQCPGCGSVTDASTVVTDGMVTCAACGTQYTATEVVGYVLLILPIGGESG